MELAKNTPDDIKRIKEAYVSLLMLRGIMLRVSLQSTLCNLRDILAERLDLEAQYVQEECEAEAVRNHIHNDQIKNISQI